MLLVVGYIRSEVVYLSYMLSYPLSLLAISPTVLADSVFSKTRCLASTHRFLPFHYPNPCPEDRTCIQSILLLHHRRGRKRRERKEEKGEGGAGIGIWMAVVIYSVLRMWGLRVEDESL